MVIYTIGHSVHGANEFVSLLKSFDINVLADVRSYPGSRHVPQFNKETLPGLLAGHNIGYVHIPKLGGRRGKIPGIDYSLVGGWKNSAFSNYAAYTLTSDFRDGLTALTQIAKKQTACIMCAESVPWRCHRLIVSNSLHFEGFEVRHILDENKFILHELNKYGARTALKDGTIIYPKEN